MNERRPKLRHDAIIEIVIMSIIKCILRYLLMTAYIYTCDRFGLYNYGLIAKIVVTLTSICVSRFVMREIGRMIAGTKMDDPMFQGVGIVACIREILTVTGRW